MLLLSLAVVILVLFTKGSRQISDPEPVPVAPEPSPAPEVVIPPPVRSFIDFMNGELDSTLTVGAAYTGVKDGQGL